MPYILKINKDIGLNIASFTPAFYKRAYRNYINGDYRDLLSLIEHAEIDAYIAGCLMARNAGYKRKWEILPASESAQDNDIAQFVKEVFDNLYMREFFEDMVDARYKDYVVINLNWDVVSGRQVFTKSEKLHQKYFRRDPKDDMKLKVDWGNRLEEIEPGSAFVIESSRIPIMLTVLQAYILKEFGRENWSKFIETFGMPFPIGTYPPGADPKIISELEAAVKNAGSARSGVKPEGTSIDFIETAKTTGDHRDFVRDAKEDISIALLGHKDAAGSDKQMQIGDNESGIKVKHDIAVDDMHWIEDNVRPLFKMLVDRNFNVNAYPKLSIDKTQSVDARTKLEAARLGLDAGAEIDPKFLAEFGIPLMNSDNPLKKQPSIMDFGG